MTRANALSYDAAITLALETDSVIQFDEVSQNPYYEFTDVNDVIPRKHIVWYVDARSIDALASLATEFNTQGIAVWNIMNHFPQMWQVINSQYEIVTILQ